jgi:hypothetical protein
MTLAPGEQRALLRMERSLRRDPALCTALRDFKCRCCCEADPDQEDMSPWHPVLWRAELLGLITLTLTFFTMIAVMASMAL